MGLCQSHGRHCHGDGQTSLSLRTAMVVRTLDNIDVTGRRVLVRADLNVAVNKGEVTDTTRIERVCPTLAELSNKRARVIVLSHFDRPKGKYVPEMSLEPIAPVLANALRRPVAFARDCIGTVAQAAVARLNEGDILLLENTRFHPGEEDNDRAFAAELARLGEIYINDAFSCAHRAHASTEALAYLMPCAAGRAMEGELGALKVALANPERPLVAVVGGAKVSTKLAVLENLTKKVDALVIGGGMANTFLHAQGKPVGKSLCEYDLAPVVKRILDTSRAEGCAIILPTDVVVAKELKAMIDTETVNVEAVERDDLILDVGPDTLAHIAARFETAKTVVWNGPLGAFETPPFDAGTNMAARLVGMLTRIGALNSVAGGGDTVAALNNAGAADDFTYVSTAGGAFLEWLEGRSLPGVEALGGR
jgi:phosphoglycerate kinase